MTAEESAEKVLQAAGSGLRHYTPRNRDAIIAAMQEVMDQVKGETE